MKFQQKFFTELTPETTASHSVSPTAYYVFTSTGWLEWLFFLAAFPGSYVMALARNRYGPRRKGDEALIPQ